MQELADRITAYAAHRLPGASEVAASGVDRIHGGASRETYRFVLRYREGGREFERRLILRRDPPGSLIETERAAEFAAYRAFYKSAVPVPEALWLESDPKWLDHPFFVMEELAGFEASPQAITAPPYLEHHERLAREKWSILGAIAAADPEKLGLYDALPVRAPADCWRYELDYWSGVIDKDELEPQPIIRAAIRALRRAPPPPPKRLHVVHGDYRTGNFLYDKEGAIRGILDWEMAHLGDPLEDLAWCSCELWRGGTPWAGAMIAPEEFFAAYARASGRAVDPERMAFYRVLAVVKMIAIMLTGIRAFRDGRTTDLRMAIFDHQLPFLFALLALARGWLTGG